MSAELDLLYTDVEEALRDSVRRVLTKRCGPDRVAEVYDTGSTTDDAAWQVLASDLGLAALLVSEENGGAGASAREAAVVLEELGRAVAPVPFLTSSVIATTVLEKLGAADLLEQLANGEKTAALVLPFTTGPDGFTTAVSVSGAGELSGTVTSVAGALAADVLIVPVASQGGLDLFEVPADDARITAVSSLDMTRQIADVELIGVAGTRLATGAEASNAVQAGLETGAALLASEQLGIAQWCLDATVEYLKVRKQFGRVVGGFQALKHRLADLYVMVESARAAARYAAASVAAQDPDSAVAASLAQAYCSDVAVFATEECVQLHGGIGMTWEHPAHLYLKRAKASQIGLGTPGMHRKRLAELVDLPAA
ncbi:acyl-CoA dehydrogenase family protein [Hoyosella altamirensis]|uniref:Alkylation response protein AidB-like acyl-CoA dehydrogenase n=1 Tax=Hoyosella altamirensis TaxID=616997 RepID=A0A839RI54_9ACTN|nr:acyl-CoA dehydrogenase family protein [Hoyosella altamirensis]MBB3036472.1 alkylation response protein AidB-like acyl-CoA dehydrogenase [Hoyosella altamirensis]